MPEARIIKLRKASSLGLWTRLHYPSAHKWDLNSSRLHVSTLRTNTIPTPALHACYHSREIIRRTYKESFSGIYLQHLWSSCPSSPIYFDIERDVLYLGGGIGGTMDMSFFETASEMLTSSYTIHAEPWKYVKHLAIHMDDDDWEETLLQYLQPVPSGAILIRSIEEMENLETLYFIGSGPFIDKMESDVWEAWLTEIIIKTQNIPEGVLRIKVATEKDFYNSFYTVCNISDSKYLLLTLHSRSSRSNVLFRGRENTLLGVLSHERSSFANIIMLSSKHKPRKK